MRIRIPAALALAILCSSAGAAQARTSIFGNAAGDEIVLDRVLNKPDRPLFASVRDQDGPFVPLRALSPGAEFDQEDAAVDDAGGAVAVWMRVRGYRGYGDVFVSVRPPDGAPSRGVQISRDPHVGGVRLAMNGRGDAAILWSRSTGPFRYVFRPAGGGFGLPASIPGSGPPLDSLPFAAIDPDGGLFFLWQRDASLLAVYRPPGGPAQSPDAVAGPPQDTVFEETDDESGDMLIAWKQDSTIQAIQRKPGADRFGGVSTIATGLKPPEDVGSLEVEPNGRAMVRFGRRIVTRDEAGRWSTPEEVPAEARFFRMSLSMNGEGDVAAVWRTADATARAAYRPAGSRFGPSLTLDPVLPPSFDSPWGPAVFLDGNGRATATWERSNGRRIKTYAHDFDADGLGARHLIGSVRSYVREGPKSNCRPSWGRVIRRTRRSTLILGTHGSRRGTRFGCLFSRGAPVDLYESDGIYPPIPLAGPFVGYATDGCEGDRCDTFIQVTDLRDELGGLNRLTGAGPTRLSEVPALKVRATGAATWVSCARLSPAYGAIQLCTAGNRVRKRVYAWDRNTREPRLLQVSRRIDPASLWLRGGRVTWRDAGKLRSARLR